MPVTLRDALAAAVTRLTAAGVDTPRLDAELLLAHAVGRDRTYVAAHLPDRLPPEAADRFEALLERRAARVPLPYLLGSWEWLGLPFRVGPAALIPRPETEVLVQEAARRLPADARVLDVGAGTGCVAAGLAHLLPGARVTALEPSAPAAALARENVGLLGLAGRVAIRQATLAEWVAGGDGGFDAVVSNPPYIPTGAIAGLAPEVRDHEPLAALDGGLDGLDLLRELATSAPALLVPGGLLAVEVAQGQADAFRGLLAAAGAWDECEVVADLAGTPRVVLARTTGVRGSAPRSPAGPAPARPSG